MAIPIGTPGNTGFLNSATKRGALHRAEAEAVTRLEVVANLLRRQHLVAENFIANPRRGTLYVQFDYKENNSLPLGPEEGGDWHWATFCEQVAFWGVFPAAVFGSFGTA